MYLAAVRTFSKYNIEALATGGQTSQPLVTQSKKYVNMTEKKYKIRVNFLMLYTYLIKTDLMKWLTTAWVIAHLIWNSRLQTIRVADTTLNTETLPQHKNTK